MCDVSVGNPSKTVLCNYEIESKMPLSPFKLDLHQVKAFLLSKILGQFGLSIHQDIPSSITGIHHGFGFYSKTSEECPGLHHQIAEAIMTSIWKGRRAAKELVSHVSTWAGSQLNTRMFPGTLVLKEQSSLSCEAWLSHHGSWQIPGRSLTWVKSHS